MKKIAMNNAFLLSVYRMGMIFFKLVLSCLATMLVYSTGYTLIEKSTSVGQMVGWFATLTTIMVVIWCFTYFSIFETGTRKKVLMKILFNAHMMTGVIFIGLVLSRELNKYGDALGAVNFLLWCMVALVCGRFVYQGYRHLRHFRRRLAH